jgi:hypothetical protein
MTLPESLTQALHGGRLLVLWGALPFPLAARAPADRGPALDRLPVAPALPAAMQGGLTSLPPLPILSLDAGERLERAFAAAGVPLQAVRGRGDVPTRGRHSLLKLAGDLGSRTGVVLSRAEVRELRRDPEKRYLLDEARGTVQGGAVLLLGCDPADGDFGAWWAALAPLFRDAAPFAVGDAAAPWPEGIACMGPDLAALAEALRAAQPPRAPEPVPAEPRPGLTATAHTLPFDRLSPRDFERLCLWLVEAEGYEEAEHLGAAGSEQGRDLVAWRDGVQWAFQCQRVGRFGPSAAVGEVEKVLDLPQAERPAGLIFLVTCDVSARTRQRARRRCGEEMACQFWAGTELDLRVKRHDDIVTEFFAGGLPAGREGRPGGSGEHPAGDIPRESAAAADAGGQVPAAVRDLLLAAFTAEDLRRLFLYTSNADLHPLLQAFSPSDGLAAMVDKTITFCQTRDLLPDLLREVEGANPRQYAHFAQRLRI